MVRICRSLKVRWVTLITIGVHKLIIAIRVTSLTLNCLCVHPSEKNLVVLWSNVAGCHAVVVWQVDNYEKSCRSYDFGFVAPWKFVSDTGNNRCTQVDNCCSCDKSDTELLYVCLSEQILWVLWSNVAGCHAVVVWQVWQLWRKVAGYMVRFVAPWKFVEWPLVTIGVHKLIIAIRVTSLTLNRCMCACQSKSCGVVNRCLPAAMLLSVWQVWQLWEKLPVTWFGFVAPWKFVEWHW